jgi:hypothetical protein
MDVLYMDIPSAFPEPVPVWARHRAGVAGSIAAFSSRIQGKNPNSGKWQLGWHLGALRPQPEFAGEASALATPLFRGRRELV